jgi:hypothetical protein
VINLDPQTIGAIGTVAATVTAAVAVIVSWKVFKGQSALAERIARDQTQLSANIAIQQSGISLKIHENQTRLSQRQLLLPLWEYISTLNNIDPQKPIGPEILKVVNTLELVALTCEGGMVDTQVIKRTFSEWYLKLYDQVAAVPQVPGRNVSGMALLMENPSAMAFYDELKREHMNRGRLTP